MQRALCLSLLGDIAHDDLHRGAAFPSQRRADRLHINKGTIQTHSALNIRLGGCAGFQSPLVLLLYFCSLVWQDKIQRRTAQEIVQCLTAEQSQRRIVGENNLPVKIDQHGVRIELNQRAVTILSRPELSFNYVSMR